MKDVNRAEPVLVSVPSAERAGKNPSLALAIAAWLDAKGKRSDSAKTRIAYADTLASFRATCLAVGLDLDAGDVRALALVAR